MRELQLALGIFLNRLRIPEELGDTENSGERIIQLVGDTREHLAHGRAFFRLNELLLKPLQLRNIPPGTDHPVDFSRPSENRTQRPPLPHQLPSPVTTPL